MITILITSRSGSTMTAGIFKAHGVTFGRGKNNEDENVIAFIRQNFKQNWYDPAPVPESVVKEFHRQFPNYPYTGWKGAAWWYPMWEKYKPKIILPKRDVRASSLSLIDKNASAKQEDIDKIIAAKQKAYDYVEGLIAEHGGAVINTDEVIDGDYSSLINAFEVCGLEFDPTIARKVINPKQWHFRSEALQV